MKTFQAIGIALLMIILPSFSGASPLGELRVSLIEGDVQVKTVETNEWVPASINMPVREGDSFWMPEESRLEIQLRDGTSIRLDEYSFFDVLRIEDSSTQFYLAEGHAYINYRDVRSDLIQIDTPDASVRAYDRTVFRVDVRRDGRTDISVFTGGVHAESSQGRTLITRNRMLTLRGDDYAEVSPVGPSDAWERWNRNRDERVYEQRYSSRYLPDELEGYANDLDTHGKWVYVREHGYVWTPVTISAGWSPYREGRWVWLGGDYVWISYEPWGWAPYHYGRWTFMASIGWCWVPPPRGAVYWGPGYVGWVHSPSYVAWVPLAPGEIYYGYGYYGPHSVNLINVNISTVRVTHVHRNVHVRHAVTVVKHDTFLGGRYERVTVKENPFLDRERVHIGRPLIKPERVTYMPSLREVPAAKRPPRERREVGIEEIRKERPLVKEQRRSVLRSSSTQQDMPVKILRSRPGSETRISEDRAPSPRRQVRPPERKGMDDNTSPGEIRRGSGGERPSARPSTPSHIQQTPQRKEVITPGGSGTERKRGPSGVITPERKSYKQESAPEREGPSREYQMRPSTGPDPAPSPGVRGRSRQTAPGRERQQ